MNQLASRILLSKSGLTRLIDRMEAEGLVERASSPNDRRGSFAVLTPRGEQVFREAAPIHLDGIHKHFASHLTATEAKTLARAFEKIRGPLISAAECAPPD
jgi:DNA-binding MarR family transcriptional regulator